MNRVAIVQARTGSSRLPGKVLAALAGRPMLAQVLKRLKACRQLDAITVATSVAEADDDVARIAQDEGVECFRGSEQDVLARYVGAAHATDADVVVRITADCPLVDPQTVDVVVAALEQSGCDYASNIIDRTYPQGLDAEAFHRDVLERVNRLGQSAKAREHVTWFLLREQPELFVMRSVKHDQDHSDQRWTVDYPEDLAIVRRFYDELRLDERILSYEEMIAAVLSHPEWVG